MNMLNNTIAHAVGTTRASPLDHLFPVTFFKTFTADEKTAEDYTARALATRIRTATAARKDRLPWLKLARFGDLRTDKRSLRHDANVLAISGIEADYDGGKMPFEQAAELLERQGVAAILYTSPSHTEDAPRWRVLCPLSAELPPERRAPLLGRLNGLFSGIFSGESWALSQSYYFGSVSNNPSHRVALIDGLPIDDHHDLDHGWIGKPDTSTTTAPNGERISGPLDAAALLVAMGHGSNYHQAQVRLAGLFVRNNVPFMEARKILRDAMESVPEADRDARWHKRFADIDRTLADIFGKEARKQDERDGGSAENDTEAAMGAGREGARGRDRAGNAPPPDPKRPLFRPLPPAPEFPIAALGELRRAAEAIAETVRAPIAICAQSVLAAATLAIQAHYDVELPGAGRRPLTGLFVSVAESGDRKSSVDRLALRPIHAEEAIWRATEEAARGAHKNHHDAWQAAREHAKKAAKNGAEAAREAFERCGPEPKAPPHPMLLVADPTPEALILHLAEGRPWGGLFTAEAGLVVGGAAFTDELRMRTGALLNCLWDGDPIRRRRVTTGAHYLPGRRCSVHMMMQPTVAPRLFGDAMLSGIGLLARVLLVAPESLAGTRMWREPPPGADADLQDYTARLRTYLARQPRTCVGSADVLDPVSLPLHPDAARMFIAFHDACERELHPEGSLASIRAFAAKMPEHAGRLAAVLTAYANPRTVEVTPEAMAGGIELAQHYAAELMRLADGAVLAPDLQLAARLLTWWQARPDPRCHLAAIYQRGLNAISDAAIARRIVTVLEDHEWVRRLPPGTFLDGAPRRDAWALVP